MQLDTVGAETLHWNTWKSKYIILSACPPRTSTESKSLRCQGNDSIFLEKWPEAMQGPTALQQAIRLKKQASGEALKRSSKYGTPEEREASLG